MQKHEQWDRRWELADLKSALAGLGKTYVCVTSSLRSRFQQELALSEIADVESTPSDAETLIVVGGGTLIDHAKYLRKSSRPNLKLIAIPTLWGSGAEVSPVAVLNSSRKEIHFSDELIPDHYVIWPALAVSAPAALLRYACADAWSHAFEAFCSPLATDDLRRQAAALMNEITSYPLAYDPRWFDASASACLLQARSSVGLIHGFAHVLEPLLRSAQGHDWGHAKLCSTFLWPVLRFNLSRSPKVKGLAEAFGLDLPGVEIVFKSLFDEAAYNEAMRFAEQHWDTIARDRCSRTNCVLVRRDSLQYFQQFLTSGTLA